MSKTKKVVALVVVVRVDSPWVFVFSCRSCESGFDYAHRGSKSDEVCDWVFAESYVVMSNQESNRSESGF